jgi:glyoxylase-like metal-dependent hydrolase (beta-lactamase superfamily II)
VTNSNHVRASREFSERFSVSVFAHEKAFPGLTLVRFIAIKAGDMLAGGIEVIEIDGAADRELAIYDAQDGGTLIVGDALINLEPYGFTFLPQKYCLNEKTMRRSLLQLLTKPVERLLFAHGMPIVVGASVRLRQLLEAA